MDRNYGPGLRSPESSQIPSSGRVDQIPATLTAITHDVTAMATHGGILAPHETQLTLRKDARLRCKLRCYLRHCIGNSSVDR